MYFRLLKPFVFLLGTCVLTSTTGCFRVAPKMPTVLSSPPDIYYSAADLKTDVDAYRASLKASKLDEAKTERNQIVYRVLAQLDAAYGQFEITLTTSRAGYETAGAAANLGLTAAATLVGAADIKAILAATSTAFQGTQLSFDKNFFAQQTTQALVSQMRASRKTLQAQIIQSLTTKDAVSYPLEAAWTDIIGYYYAGTLPSALVAVTSKAGADDVTADQTLVNAKALTTFTPAQAQSAITIRSAYTTLSQQLKSSDTAAAAAVVSLKKILTAAGVSFSATASSNDLLTALQNAMAAAASDPALLDKLATAVQSAMPH
jgi:hypothetical protein